MFAFTPRLEVWIKNLKKEVNNSEKIWIIQMIMRRVTMLVKGSDDPRSEGRKFRSHNRRWTKMRFHFQSPRFERSSSFLQSI